jgi:predicted DNA-binding ribbon-helix-helix protein
VWYDPSVQECTYAARRSRVRTERVEVRLDAQTRGKLERVARARGSTVSELVRSLIEESYEEEARAERLRAAERIGAMELEDVPAPEELKRQFDAAHGGAAPETP